MVLGRRWRVGGPCHQTNGAEAGYEGHQLTVGAAGGGPRDGRLRRGSRRFRTGPCPAWRPGEDGRRRGQGRILHGLPRPVGPGLSRLSHHAAACGAASRVHREPVAQFRRAQPRAESLHQHGAGCTVSARTCERPWPRISAGSIRGRSAAARAISLGTGKRIYDEGIPEANIPACAACHGPDAKGQEAIPRLAGQLYAYTVKELTNWSRERGQGSAKDDTSAVMTPIAHALTPAQVSAIAAYLSYLR